MQGQFSGRYLPSMYDEEDATAFSVDQAAAYFLAQPTQQLPHGNQSPVSQRYSG